MTVIKSAHLRLLSSTGGAGMLGNEEPRWRVLCELAVDERDPKKFAQLIEEIERILQAKNRRLNAPPSDEKIG
jgi:hypothetical protein